MADTSLRNRLREHADAFDGLLSLIPAKIYYGEDTTDHWKRTKQTKEQARAARRGKLDPDSELNRNAKEVMDERARNKRRLEDMQEDMTDGERDIDEDFNGLHRDGHGEQPGEGLTKQKGAVKRQKRSDGPDPRPENSARMKAREEKRLLKRQVRAEKIQAKADTRLAASPADATAETTAWGRDSASKERDNQQSLTTSAPPVAESSLPRNAADVAPRSRHTSPSHSPTSNSGAGSPIFDGLTGVNDGFAEAASTTTSMSSTTAPEREKKGTKHIKIPADSSALRLRLAAKIEALRAARKADDEDGKPIRTRQELIEARREKQAERKAHKKELRRLTRAEEERKREEALASARNSPGGVLSPAAVDVDGDESPANHFAFGKVAFADGTAMSHDLSYAKEQSNKRKGAPADPKSALAKLAAQKKRVAGLDDDKRKEVLEKETWLAARRRAEGDRIHDDESLLKKAVKRKEKAKKRSETEWKGRSWGVQQAMKDKQRKREDNIQKRKEQKVLGKAGKRKGGKPAAPKKKNRAGFEGSFGRK